MPLEEPELQSGIVNHIRMKRKYFDKKKRKQTYKCKQKRKYFRKSKSELLPQKPLIKVPNKQITTAN